MKKFTKYIEKITLLKSTFSVMRISLNVVFGKKVEAVQPCNINKKLNVLLKNLRSFQSSENV